MTSAGFGWRSGGVVFVVLSVIVLAVGWVTVQFDDQYQSTPITERIFVGFLGGALGVAIAGPAIAVVAGGVGLIAARHHRRRTTPPDG